MDLLKKLFCISIFLPLSGCYYLKSAYHQVDLLVARVPIEEALQNKKLTEEQKAKLRLSQEARVFSQDTLGLKSNGNYTSYVQLDQPYVTYALSAAPKWELKHHLWDFPFVGKVPYKGFFEEADGKAEQKKMQEDGLDTYLRGVAAYSTLGWFKDPVLSSMLEYKEPDLVNVIIHETVHATLYIKSNADFNERLAVFMGNWGTEIFYKKREGENSKTLAEIKFDNQDEKVFADFISKEIDLLTKWYQSSPAKDEDLRLARLKEIQTRFESEVKPRLKTKRYEKFTSIQLNNARLLVYKTYLADLSNFEKLAIKLGWDFGKFLEEVKTLEKGSDPEEGLKRLLER